MSKPVMLILGGTGSLGKALISSFLSRYDIAVFSRDEAKHVNIKRMYPTVKSLIGDIRDRDSVFNALISIAPDIIINAAALKNVPEVEEVPMEGIKTSLIGAENVIQAVQYYSFNISKKIKVLTISTDKACKPVNSYGMAKALQERLHIRSNSKNVVCNAVRYGNVLESRGSLIPFLKKKLEANETFYITHKDMTRFFLTLQSSVDLVDTALQDNEGGKIFVPDIKGARIVDVVDIFRESYNRDSSLIQFSKIRPGEKIDEVLISKEELSRTERLKNVYVIHDILTDKSFDHVKEELSSNCTEVILEKPDLIKFLKENGVLDD